MVSGCEGRVSCSSSSEKMVRTTRSRSSRLGGRRSRGSTATRHEVRSVRSQVEDLVEPATRPGTMAGSGREERQRTKSRVWWFPLPPQQADTAPNSSLSFRSLLQTGLPAFFSDPAIINFCSSPSKITHLVMQSHLHPVAALTACEPRDKCSFLVTSFPAIMRRSLGA